MNTNGIFKLKKCNFEISVIANDGSVRDCGVHPNLILDGGMIGLISGSGAYRQFRLGTGSTTPERTQTSLATPISGGSGIFNNSGSATVTTGTDEDGPYIQWSSSGTSSSFSSATNITEIGFSSQTGNNFLSRALIRNSEGVPTSISVLAGELVVATYNFRLYLPNDTITGDITVTTDGVPATVAWESKPRAGASVTIGTTGGNLQFVYPTSNIWYTNNDINTKNFTRENPVIQPYGVSCVNYFSKTGNTGNETFTRFRSNATALTLPIDITFTPSIVVTNDQRARFEFVTYLTQDYS